MEHEVRPWGEYFVLDDSSTHKVKRIVVKPGGRLSYQYHFHRAEVWTIVEGEALITIDEIDQTYKVGEVAIIPLKAKHRIQNKSEQNLVFIEVQWGESFEEDDIVRIEDDYNRN
ncbi:phosphomannose isomerase type II C-terminal cupin domain [Flavobacterium lacus]|uniref:Mannose-6-phosphate isomerase n=1 Tax=Flavobacterium lacus TaxID=1353778 RepID=A0A328WWK9_9FLAO|nr:phosphomannose isomerase type II C-terminal cupin domain [Flavobacterium lacus]RAR47229.1 mannose-6-phosphate isomerase [Flavobacterium lacus]